VVFAAGFAVAVGFFWLQIRRRTILSPVGVAGLWIPRLADSQTRHKWWRLSATGPFVSEPIPWDQVNRVARERKLNGEGLDTYEVFVCLTDGRKARLATKAFSPSYADGIVGRVQAALTQVRSTTTRIGCWMRRST
jgi:hypothetical protein